MFFKFEPDLQPSVQVKLEGAKAEETQNFVKNLVFSLQKSKYKMSENLKNILLLMN